MVTHMENEILYKSDKRISIDRYDITDINITGDPGDHVYKGTIQMLDMLKGEERIANMWELRPRDNRMKFLRPMNSMDISFQNGFETGEPDPDYINRLEARLKYHTVCTLLGYKSSVRHDLCMKHLFVVRHGDNDGDNLNERGRDDMRLLAGHIRDILGGEGVKILSAPGNMARRIGESADIMAPIIGAGDIVEIKSLYIKYVDVEEYHVVGVENECEGHTSTANGMVLVTSGPVARAFSEHILFKEFDYPKYIEPPNKGTGIHIDNHSGKFTLL